MSPCPSPSELSVAVRGSGSSSPLGFGLSVMGCRVPSDKFALCSVLNLCRSSATVVSATTSFTRQTPACVRTRMIIVSLRNSAVCPARCVLLRPGSAPVHSGNRYAAVGRGRGVCLAYIVPFWSLCIMPFEGVQTPRSTFNMYFIQDCSMISKLYLLC